MRPLGAGAPLGPRSWLGRHSQLCQTATLAMPQAPHPPSVSPGGGCGAGFAALLSFGVLRLLVRSFPVLRGRGGVRGGGRGWGGGTPGGGWGGVIAGV